MKRHTLEIRTPEGIAFTQILASPLTRFLAWFMDLFCVVALSIGINLMLSMVRLISPSIAQAVMTASYFIISVGYGIVCEWFWRGQTVGKKLFHLRVVDAEGMRLQFDQVVTRNLLRVADMLPGFYLLGGVTSLLNAKSQRLGDIAGNTIVIRIPQISSPDLEQLLSGKFNSLRQFPHLAARLRQRLTPEESSLALQALMRRDEFDPAARVELFDRLARYYQTRMEFPPEATEGLAPEQYVRNVVDIVYRMRNASGKSA
jgi:uncharacterized RDD family membrane protein YckC